ncbi:cyclin-dependent kinases regulatory subunit-like isoform X4 [Hylaeus anthracinus]|uniref:cyclin-dependent kinases regulatory subunit-like isoform X2 n=1 Tax=Hylaeus anthracinus TaxID=313031 RepID=UPI0023BA054C|nr:cyclin-dependent kinases regulatory subunit-like isoform X2 [Hylaeus anthracinus]XP_054016313.1 cyclin-dependent kinases regulatory subunit-like isoform X4 [Hylaeus anthracinus]
MFTLWDSKCQLIKYNILKNTVMINMNIARHVPKTHLMSETEWRNLGVQQSPGWVHYMMHVPEPHVLLFRRPRTDCLITTRPTSFQREY